MWLYIYIYIEREREREREREFIESKLDGELSVSAYTEIWQLKKSSKKFYDRQWVIY